MHLISYTSSPIRHRPDAHSLRYEFRHLVNAGAVRLNQYDAFVAFVDESGGVTEAMVRLRTGATIG